MSIFGLDRGGGVSLSQAKALTQYEGGKFKNFLIRYLADADSWKYFSTKEVQNLLTAGYMIASVFEEGENGLAGGREAGIAAATKAKATAQRVGQTKNSAIFFAVDYEATSRDFDAFEAFLKAAQEVLGGDYFAGVYGEYDVIEEMAKRKACTYFWQTVAWSRGLLSKFADVYQYQIDIDADGVSVDFNECFNTNIFWGQYQAPEPIKVETLEMYHDVPVTHWAAESIKKAYIKDIMKGVSEAIFGLTEEVTREQLTVVLDKLNLLNGTPTTPVTSVEFTDVPANHWALSSIKKAHDSGIMSGTGDGTFGLGKTLTREQFTKVLDNLGLTTVGTTYWKVNDIYKDVPSDYWAMKSIENAYLKGVLIGVAEHKFGLGEAVMREQLAKVIDNLGMLN
jgi:hypothetical protein